MGDIRATPAAADGGEHLMPAADITVLNGVPFLERNFLVPRLLAGVVVVRQVHSRNLGVQDVPAAHDITGWLSPDSAVNTRPNATPVQVRPMPPERMRRVQRAARGLGELLPHWRQLMALPMAYHLLEKGDMSLSASTYLWPQQILLSDAAFDNRQSLDELLLHEWCHQWLYLMEELWAFDVPGARRVTLPSGTSHRAPREVIGAAHVAAVTIRMYAALGVHGGERVEMFTDYGRGCLDLLDELHEDLTPAGQKIAGKLKEAL
ncbi:hypothetical protein [Streptomyces chartreusis]|uniref:hypothetical protein n=1 Tax=Streptomyces chartreusis TaxID=1969 RepID=UPI0036581DB7